MVQVLRAVVFYTTYYMIFVNPAEIEFADLKYCTVVKPCYKPLLYDVKYRCASDEVCPEGYKCCRSDCYIHRVCVVAVNKNGEKIPPPIRTSTSSTHPTTNDHFDSTTANDQNSTSEQSHSSPITQITYITSTESLATSIEAVDATDTPSSTTIFTKVEIDIADTSTITSNDNDRITYSPENYAATSNNISISTTFTSATFTEVTMISDAVEGSGGGFTDSERDEATYFSGSGDDQDDTEGSGDNNAEGSGAPDLTTSLSSTRDNDIEFSDTTVHEERGTTTTTYVTEFSSIFEANTNGNRDDEEMTTTTESYAITSSFFSETAEQSTTLDTSTSTKVDSTATITNSIDTEPPTHSTSTTSLISDSTTEESSRNESDPENVIEGSGDELTDTEADDDDDEELTSVNNLFTQEDTESFTHIAGDTHTAFTDSHLVDTNESTISTSLLLNITASSIEGTAIYDDKYNTTGLSTNEVEGSGDEFTDTEPDDDEGELTSMSNLFTETDVANETSAIWTDSTVSKNDFSFATVKLHSVDSNGSIVSVAVPSNDNSTSAASLIFNVTASSIDNPSTNELEGAGYHLTDTEPDDDEGSLTETAIVSSTILKEFSAPKADFSFVTVANFHTNLSMVSQPLLNANTTSAMPQLVNVTATSLDISTNEMEGSGYELTDTEPDDDEGQLTTISPNFITDYEQGSSKLALSENTSAAVPNFTTEIPNFQLLSFPVGNSDNLTYEEEDDEEDGDGVDEDIRNNFQSRIARG